MKLSLAALALATMTGSAAAESVFSPPITFTQFNGDCSGEPVYRGAVSSIAMIEEGSFCFSSTIVVDGTEQLEWSRVNIVECTEDKIYEDWHNCDTDCANCEVAYQAYTNWGSIKDDEVIGHCYDYFFAVDDAVDATGATKRMFDATQQINFSFDLDNNAADVNTYVRMLDDNSCIKEGVPAADVTVDIPDPVVVAETPESEDEPVDTVDTESGASTLVATAAVAMAAATTMLLA